MLFWWMLLAAAPGEPRPAPPTVVSLPPPPPVYVPAPPAPSAPNGLAVPGMPSGNPGDWVTPDDYPIRAMREGREGTTGFRLSYDAKGQPQTCDVVSSSGHADLDNATCTLTMVRARFRPGRDAAGKPVGGTYTNSIRWQMPEPLANRFADGATTVEFTLGTDGKARDCKTEQFGTPDGLPFPGEEACDNIPQFEPFRDAAGAAVERRVRLHMSVSVTDADASAAQTP